MHSNKESDIRISMTVHSKNNSGCTIEGLTEKELEVVEGSIRGGHHWIRRSHEGRLEHVPSYKALPSPIEDKDMLPFWRKPTDECPVQMEVFPHRNTNNDSPSITIQHLCGYHYTPEDYTLYATRLESYGFECLRSRRGNDGKFWEVWHLCGLWMAEGDLRDAIEKETKSKRRFPITEARELRVALNFLAQNVSFGTLDVSTQRMAMTIDGE